MRGTYPNNLLVLILQVLSGLAIQNVRSAGNKIRINIRGAVSESESYARRSALRRSGPLS